MGTLKDSKQINQKFTSKIRKKKIRDSERRRITCLVTVISEWSSYPRGLRFLSELSKTMETVAFVIPA